MTELKKQTSTVTWRPDYDAEPLMVSDWKDKDGWDFLGCIVDIQLRRANGDYFFVKYTGSIEGTEEDEAEEGVPLPRVVYHFGVEKISGDKWIFRPKISTVFAIIIHRHLKRRAWKKGDLSFRLPKRSPLPRTCLRNWRNKK